MNSYAAQIVDGLVTRVIVGDAGWATANIGGEWVDSLTKVGVGYTYNAVANVFIIPKPYPSWTLDGNFDWQPPTPMPDDGTEYVWDEANLIWQPVPTETGDN